MNDVAVLIRYHEIALKKGNRVWFEEKLVQNIQKMLRRELGRDFPFDIQRLQGRILLQCEWGKRVESALSRVFGINSYSVAHSTPTQFEELKEQALIEVRNHLERYPDTATFRVSTKRSDKALNMTSMEIDREIGAHVLAHFPELKVDLHHPDLWLGLEVRLKQSYFWREKLAGPKGLPVGSNSPVLTLLSGGLDSPVAAVQALKRGTTTNFIHFYGTPFVGEEVLEKIVDLARECNQYQPTPQPLYVVPFGKIQEKIALATNPKLRTILYRRMMLRIACRFAPTVKAKALITGESLGQVASQTLENLAVIDSATTLPILRPLITWDKDEIIEVAKQIGTYETSIRPGLDCCTLFSDRHPTLRSTLSLVEEQEARYSVEDLVQEALSQITIRRA